MATILNFPRDLPEPTLQAPLAQIEWVFEEKKSLYENMYTKNNYTTGWTFYKRFLQQTNNYSPRLEADPRFFIENEWDSMAFIKLWRWVEATNVTGSDRYLTSNTIVGNISTIRQVMEYAFEHGYIRQPVINVSMPPAVRETNARTAFSTDEFDAIFKAISPMIRFSKNLVNPYKKTGIGKDPRIDNKLKGQGRDGLSLPRIAEGWHCWEKTSNGYATRDDNMRWYFENVMNCIPLMSTNQNKKKHRAFFAHAIYTHGGLNNLYQKWGVCTIRSKFIIMPLLVELIAETGLNVESMLSLRRDCLKDHPLTGLPYIEYNKPRSGGVKELHLPLYDEMNGQGFESETQQTKLSTLALETKEEIIEKGKMLNLKQHQSRIISQTISIILKLTEPLARKAEIEDQEYLFLIETRHNNEKSKSLNARRVHTKDASKWTAKMVRDHDLKGDDGKPLIFTLSRFRPTKITKLVQEGYDIFSIMQIAGHKSIITTLSYVDKIKSAADYERTITRSLISIKEKMREQEKRPLPIAISPNDQPGEYIFRTTICHCKNPYDPPKEVRNSSNYHQGDACTHWNMCLTCDNVLISEAELPQLIAYRNHIAQALANVSDIPRQGELYKSTLLILNEILSPDEIFSQAVLDHASTLALDAELNIYDSFIYRG